MLYYAYGYGYGYGDATSTWHGSVMAVGPIEATKV